jgi:hypothetical protein
MRRLAYVAAAALAVSGFGLAGCDDDTDLSRNDNGVEFRGEIDAQPAADRVDTAVNDAGNAADRAADRTSNAAKDTADRADRAIDGTIAPKGTAAAPDAEGIRDLFASSTQAVFTKGGFDDLIERLVDADRNRLGEFDDSEMADLDGLVAQLQKDWQAKYDNEFDIENEEMVYSDQFLTIQQGEIGKDPKLASDTMKQTGAVTENTDEDKNVDEGRNIASVMVKASHGLPDLTVPLIHELPDNWRINVPDTLDGAKLKQNLMNHLTHLSQNKARWPQDVNEAHRLVSHHVLMALLDKPVPAASNSMP